MKYHMFSRLLIICFFLLVNAACSLDSMTGTRPAVEPLLQKATVDQVPGAEPDLKKPLTAPLLEPALPNQLPIKPVSMITPSKASPVAVQEEMPILVQPVTAAVAKRVNSRKPNLPSKADMVYRNVILEEDAVWRGEVMVTGWVTVPPHITLTIESGTSVHFIPEDENSINGSGLLVQGRVVAGGATGKPVVFSGKYNQPEAGDWQGIVILASDKKNVLEECRVEGASIAVEVLYSQLTLRNVVATASGTGIRLRDSILNYAGGGASGCGFGIQSADSELDMRDLNLSSNSYGVVVSGGSLHLSGATFYGNEKIALTVEGGKLKVSGSSLTVNGTGMRISGAEGVVSFNRILSNREVGLHLINARIRVTGNEISQNSVSGIKIANGGNVIWNNLLAANNGHDLEYSGESDLAAMGNWWGMDSIEKVQTRIRTSGSSGRVLCLPLLPQRPQLGI